MSNRNKNILLGILIVGVLAMTVAFAALTTRLNLSGTANVAALKWNIHFDGWDNVTQDTVDGHSNTSEIDDTKISQTLSPNITKIDNVNVTLKQPGDYIKYNFIIKNDGTIAGKLSNFTKTLTPTNEVVGFTVNCYESNTREGTPITTNYVLPADGTVYCYLEVQYKDQTNTNTSGSNQVYEQSAINASITADWTWVQDDSNSSQGSQQSEEPEPTPVTQTWNKYYSANQTSGTTQKDPNWTYWVQENTSTGEKEVCGEFSNGTVCINQNSVDFLYDSSTGAVDGIDVNGQKTLALGAELENKCDNIDPSSPMLIGNSAGCTDKNTNVGCEVNRYQEASCVNGTVRGGCNLEANGNVFCY